ncbi:hypothetical protein [Streptomyces sp. RFCAC02]|uniref:hypothetical protein n=1 Tax=Streptomyces sp. RFCAC02 TaxID=2499143 RepID=UPI00102062C5|nr:hypothetical protein [Streptomyces sp. RFCAC02]
MPFEVGTDSLNDFSGWVTEQLTALRDARVTSDEVEGLSTGTSGHGSLQSQRDFIQRYEAMRVRLGDHIRMQQEAIEILSIATRLSGDAFATLDADESARIRDIMAGWEEYYATHPPLTAPADNGGGGGGGGRDMKA